MNQVEILDLNFMSDKNTGAFLIPSSEGPILIDTGPATTFNYLEASVKNAGFHIKDIKHVLLTHIHFDHAGAAWKLAGNGALVYVHPAGLPHLANPEKLWNSATKIYGSDMERLWGEIKPISLSQLVPANNEDTICIGNITINVWFTPGHASHHNAYQLDDIVFTGDVAGIKIGDGPVQPPCPPPDVNIELWLKSIQKLKNLHPSALYLAHFGRQENVSELLHELEGMLKDWSEWIRPYFQNNMPAEKTIPAFESYTRNQLLNAGLTEQEILRYQYANPTFMSVTGLYRYWNLKSRNQV